MDFLQGLNPQQREAVAHTEGAVLILAGAGSGKTRVITHRIAHLIQEKRVPASAVLAVTFTNKAADEMRQRVAALLEGGFGDRPRLSTFHSFCVRLLRRDGDPLAEFRPGFTRQFTIYDDDDQVVIIKAAYKRLGLDEKFMKHRAALSAISHAKSRKERPEDVFRRAKDPNTNKLAVLFEEYEKALRLANALDFDDLLIESVRLLHHDEATREQYNRSISYLMIDEYQDTNRSQYELMRLLSVDHGNVCVVGDEDQSIYSWRGADIRNILDFEKDFPNARTIRLEQNYRSTRNILAAAGAVVANNTERKGKNLWTDAVEGDRVSVYTAFDGENEALFMADTIERLIQADASVRVAVLYRTNFQSRQIEEALRRYGRRYLVVGGFSFYQRAEIKDVLAYLKAALSPVDSISLLRVINTPARGIGRTTVEQIEQFALQHELSVWNALTRMLDERQFPTRAQAALQAFRSAMEEIAVAARDRDVKEALKFIVERTGYGRMLEQDPSPESETRAGNLNELINAAAEAAERGEDAASFLDHAALVADADSVDEDAQVSLLTIHNAKGLEFPVVFLSGMEEGLFPHIRSFDSQSMMEEERRLCYVGMTRAEKRLYLTWARYRRRFGGGDQERTMRSRFLAEVPEDLVIPMGAAADTGGVDLTAESWEVRESARRNLFTGKTYNSVDNIRQFFAERGRPFPATAAPPRTPPPTASRVTPAAPRQAAAPVARAKTAARPGNNVVNHPKYGRGLVVRREGEGEEAKLTVSFPGYGLKKIIAKYVGLKTE